MEPHLELREKEAARMEKVLLSRPHPLPQSGEVGGGRFKNLLKNLLLLLTSSLIAWLLGEALVLLILGEQAKFPRHVVGSSFGLRINQPNSRYRHKSADGTFWFQINGQGMRADHDFSYAKPPGLKRIVSLGDSFTIGYEVNNDQTFSSILEQRLRSSGINVEVLNAGVSGYSNAEEVLYLERELFKYSPDVVLLSFAPNDLEDNPRTNLFKFDAGKLIEADRNYIPLGRIADILNRNAIASFLSERSNLFVLLKERANIFLKVTRVSNNVEVFELTQHDNLKNNPSAVYQRQLAGAILERLYSWTHSRNIPLVIQSIAWPGKKGLMEMFPFADFDVHRPGIIFLSDKPLLDPYVGKEKVFNARSHWHYTALAHRLVGDRLARLILEDTFEKP
jgi:hypothetical protein